MVELVLGRVQNVLIQQLARGQNSIQFENFNFSYEFKKHS